MRLPAQSGARSNLKNLWVEPMMKLARKEMKAIRKEQASLELAHETGEIDEAFFKAEDGRLDEEQQAGISGFNSEYLAAVEQPARPD
jgi:hypothetical protein